MGTGQGVRDSQGDGVSSPDLGPPSLSPFLSPHLALTKILGVERSGSLSLGMMRM